MLCVGVVDAFSSELQTLCCRSCRRFASELQTLFRRKSRCFASELQMLCVGVVDALRRSCRRFAEKEILQKQISLWCFCGKECCEETGDITWQRSFFRKRSRVSRPQELLHRIGGEFREKDVLLFCQKKKKYLNLKEKENYMKNQKSVEQK